MVKLEGEQERITRLKGQVKNTCWYRGEDCNFFPNKSILTSPGSIEKLITYGWTPPKPFITKQNDIIIAFGSCFAKHILMYLATRGYNVPVKETEESHIVYHGSGLVTTFTIRQQLEWAWEDRIFPEDTWFSTPQVTAKKTKSIKEKTKDLLDKATVFIITLGLSEVWYSKENGDVFWKAIPQNIYNSEKHGFRVTTCGENIENLEKIIKLIRRHHPSAPIIFTVSPIPLRATFRPISCITANCVSKAILRAAVDEVIRNHSEDKNLYYWPSYEIVKESGQEMYGHDHRHIKSEAVTIIMGLFDKYFLVGDENA